MKLPIKVSRLTTSETPVTVKGGIRSKYLKTAHTAATGTGVRRSGRGGRGAPQLASEWTDGVALSQAEATQGGGPEPAGPAPTCPIHPSAETRTPVIGEESAPYAEKEAPCWPHTHRASLPTNRLFKRTNNYTDKQLGPKQALHKRRHPNSK